MFIFSRLFFSFIGFLVGFSAISIAAFSAGMVYGFDANQWIAEFMPYVMGIIFQYWFIILLWLFLMIVILNIGFTQLYMTFFATIFVFFVGLTFTPEKEKALSNDMKVFVENGNIIPISYSCNEIQCEIDSIKLGSDIFIERYKEDAFKSLFLGEKISVQEINKKTIYTTNNALLVYQFNRIVDSLNQILYKEKMKEKQDKKTETTIKL